MGIRENIVGAIKNMGILFLMVFSVCFVFGIILLSWWAIGNIVWLFWGFVAIFILCYVGGS